MSCKTDKEPGQTKFCANSSLSFNPKNRMPLTNLCPQKSFPNLFHCVINHCQFLRAGYLYPNLKLPCMPFILSGGAIYYIRSFFILSVYTLEVDKRKRCNSIKSTITFCGELANRQLAFIFGLASFPTLRLHWLECVSRYYVFQ